MLLSLGCRNSQLVRSGGGERHKDGTMTATVTTPNAGGTDQSDAAGCVTTFVYWL